MDGRDQSNYVWNNAAYAFGTRLTAAYAQYGWLAAISGVDGGGLVEGLPVHTFSTDDGEVALKCPTEIAITDRREREMTDQGFIPLCHCKGTDFAVFDTAQSCQKPRQYDRDEANVNARLATIFQYTFCIARFMHYLMAMVRDKIGGTMSREECEWWLNSWINYYTLCGQMEHADPMTRAKNPLREARVVVHEIEGKPGCYVAAAHIRPHFQFDLMNFAFRIVAELPESKGL